MPKVTATISGTMLRPGVSRNGRLYTPELIEKAVGRMRVRLADPDGLPIVMRSYHGAGDDSTKIVGRVRSVDVKGNGDASFTSELFDTAAGRDITNLVTAETPGLRSVSIHGYWVGDTKKVQTDEGLATTADDLEIDAIDFTASPGVVGALIDSSGKATESGGFTRTPISEAMEASVTLLEEGSGWADISRDVKESPVTRAQREGSPGATAKDGEVRLGDVIEYYPYGDTDVAGFCIDAYAGPLSVTIRGCVSADQLRAAAQAAATAAMDAINCMDPDVDGDIDVTDGDMETKKPASGAVSADDDLKDGSSESVTIQVEGRALTESDLLRIIQEQLDILAARQALLGLGTGKATQAEQAVAKRLDGKDYDQIAAEMGETEDKMTSPPGTVETVEGSDKQEESAMGDTQEVAAQAAPTTLTAEDMKMLGETIGNTMAEALRAFAEMSTPKHAAADTQETAEKAEDVAESAPSATPKADDLTALKESLANELRRELRNELRAEILEEKGLPPRRGYRLKENEETEELTDAEVFNQHRVDILLGGYASNPPVAAADAVQAV